jgi:predicted unusual protein kinase regulating ubiquinone biosynthesis (AarF/ABC1/UbiB family)
VSRTRTALVATSAAALVGAASVAGTVLRDPHRRKRVERSARVWWLSARRGAHWATVKVRGVGADEARRAELEQHFAIRTAEDVAAELGNMKGAIMKLGQLVSFIAEGLPPEAQQALASLQADVEPMAPSLAESVVRAELGDDPERLFLDWNPVPVAAASVGQVHRAVLRDGRIVAVKVQYPGVDRAIMSDLDNAELLYSMASAISLKGLDVRGFVDELRDRMGEELDYRREAANQAEFAALYRDHPFIHVPDVVPEFSAQRVITSEWVDGLTWAEFEATSGPAARQQAGEVLFRFAQGSVHRHGVFNGDPHPGNYRFHADGSITFLDFGLVKRWSPGEWERLSPCLDAILDHDAERLVAAMVESRFLPPGHGLEPKAVQAYVSAPYVPYLTERFRFSRAFTAEALGSVFDVNGPAADVIRKLNMPPSFVILDRVVWGVSALLGKLEAEGPWRAVLAEYRYGGPPATELGEQDARWWARLGRGTGQ